MDHDRFDALTRALASGASRRQVFKSLATSALGGTLVLLGARRAYADGEETEPCPAKVGICHRTEGEPTPFVFIEVCVDAVVAHAAHGDLIACPNLQVIEPETCTCICPVEEIACPAPKVLNAETCACECPKVCCPLELGLAGPDPTTCACVCDPGFPVACGPLCCPAGETCVPTPSGGFQCTGETPAGQDDCQGGCLNCEAFCGNPPPEIGIPPGSTCCARELDFTCCPPGTICTPFGGCCCPPGATCPGARLCAC